MAYPESLPTPSSGTGPEAKNFGLTEVQFTDMLNRMRAGDESLFEQVYAKQFTFCYQKLQQFDQLSAQAAYDATMDALLHFRDLLLQGKIRYGNLRYLFVCIARQLHGKKRGKQLLISAIDDEAYRLAEEFPETIKKEAFEKMERAYRQLGSACKELLNENYFKRKSLKEIAETEGGSYAALRQQKSRCIHRLRQLCSV